MNQIKETTIKDYIIHLKLGTVVVICTVVFSSLVGCGIAYEKIQARLRHLDAKTNLYQQQFDALENRVDSNDIQFAEIKKDLNSIEKTLLEIKAKLK